eukprot:TRINITY_DN30_c0_g1_i1.p1 TRINITY_DN30_c0_g1~~TRINITY_DN30_c0_g1_i1.p1  ORF type:complete len:680 (+),score=180.18 TRINITY_DN30_c0_g1_i1:63-2042(+)
MSLRAPLAQAFSVLETRFSSYDVDRAGTITFAQLVRRMTLTGFRDSERLQDLFNKVDADKSGTLDFSEFIMLMFYFDPLDRVFKGPALQAVQTAWHALESTLGRMDPSGQLQLNRDATFKFLEAALGTGSSSAPDVALAFAHHATIGLSDLMHLLYAIVSPSGRYHVKVTTKIQSLLNHPSTGRGEGSAPWMQLQQAFMALEKDFQAFDRDNSGFIDLRELTDLSADRRSKDLIDTISRLQHYFTIVDLDDSGSLGFDEYMYLAFLLVRDGGYADVVEHAVDASTVKKALLYLHQAFTKADADKSMRLTRDELHVLLKGLIGEVPAQADAIFTKLMSSSTRQHIDFVRTMRLLYELIRGDGIFVKVAQQKPQRVEQAPIVPPTEAAAQGHKLARLDNFDLSEVVKERQIGEGGFGKVYKAKFKSQYVAAKFGLGTPTREMLQDTQAEVDLMKRLPDHPNLLWLIGACLKLPELCILTEFCDNGSVFDCMHKKRMPFSAAFIWKVAREMAEGLAVMHALSPPMIHRDIKSLNILLDANMNSKIADFGLSKMAVGEMEEGVGTPQWMAPEVLSSKNYDVRSDIFSFAVVLWEMTHRQIPYGNMNQDQMINGILRGMRPAISDRCPKFLAQLMTRCWDADPARRPSMRQVCQELDAVKSQFQ